jgi:hypothetical protein
MRSILMSEHHPVKPDPAPFEKCMEFGVDPTALGKQPKPRLTTAETTADF